MTIGEKGLTLIKHFEGLRLEAYLDSTGLPTIGIGTIRYPNGVLVKQGDKITESRAMEYLMHDVLMFETGVGKLITADINQDQFDALVSFSYNLGLGALSSSRLRKVINADPNDKNIPMQFEKWVYAGGVVLKGLVKRRKAEAHLFTKGELKFDF
jgi:GH24 family phage-related lysozyme (muramidase)